MSPADSRSERLLRSETVRLTAEYQRCYREGSRRQSTLFSLIFRPNATEQARLGTTVSRKVGNAVVRNRLKRWVRECYRRSPGRSNLKPVDLVVQMKPAAAGASFTELQCELERLLETLRRETPR